MTDIPHRVQLSRRKGWRMPANTVRVSRPSPFGNYAGPTRQDFEEDLAKMSNADRAFYLEKVKALRGKNLACWCRLCDRHRDGKPFWEKCDQCAPCHADVLLELANAEEPK